MENLTHIGFCGEIFVHKISNVKIQYSNIVNIFNFQHLTLFSIGFL